jgi:hypothetical protein
MNNSPALHERRRAFRLYIRVLAQGAHIARGTHRRLPVSTTSISLIGIAAFVAVKVRQ